MRVFQSRIFEGTCGQERMSSPLSTKTRIEKRPLTLPSPPGEGKTENAVFPQDDGVYPGDGGIYQEGRGKKNSLSWGRGKGEGSFLGIEEKLNNEGKPISCGFRIADWGLRIANYELRITNYELRVHNHVHSALSTQHSVLSTQHSALSTQSSALRKEWETCKRQ